ncbi:Longitudinals lacking protein, isoforms A/B/D/L [Harpegnathos saltator]|uniref:Longitudinals lacking protein, isoforms A/B/D/L n=1 Tax=Harpegnathos saltator TaxID=610380 RepID=E2BJ94_HARSA|nr:Longitudinals lacking protein, isoforms A/B/D/L [Harpegnathos saltator]
MLPLLLSIDSAAYWNEYSLLQETRAFQQPLVRRPPQRPQQQQQQLPLLPSQGHVCKDCGKIYKQRNALWRHYKYECGKSPRFQCPYCRYRTKQRSNMYSHIKHKHDGLKIYAIDLEATNQA